MASLPSSLTAKLADLDGNKWKTEHNVNKWKSKSLSRKELRKQARKKPNQRGPANLDKAMEPLKPKNGKIEKAEKPKKKLKSKSDEYLSPFESAHEIEQRQKLDDDEAYYARKLGMKDVGLDDLGMSDIDLSEGEDAMADQNELDESDGFSFNSANSEPEDKDEGSGTNNQFSEDDELSMDDFENEMDDDEPMTAEETMEKLRQLKARKNPQTKELSESESESEEENPYVPPKLREQPKLSVQAEEGNAEEKQRMVRLFRSALNKLTEPTLNSVFSDLSQRFTEFSLAEASEVFTNELLNLLDTNQPIQATLICVYGCLVSKIYGQYGTNFGAAFIQTLVERLINQGNTNLSMLLSECFTFQIVNSTVIYNLISHFIQILDEKSVECVLSIIRSVGPQLRHDDPHELKNVILGLQTKISEVGSANLSPRMQFLVDQIMLLKNNRFKVSEVVAEQRSRLRKQHRVDREPLNVGLNDILAAKSRGKWWLVGASWKGQEKDADEESKIEIDIDDLGGKDWLAIAKKQRLNTDARRALFVAIMGAEDYLEANMRIDKLNLNSKQLRDVPFVLLHCLSQEKAYNPYYAFVASKLCAKHQTMKTFQFTLWDWLQTSERPQVVMHYARFYAQLAASQVMPLDMLKTFEFLSPSASNKLFLEMFLIAFYTQMGKSAERAKKRAKSGFSLPVSEDDRDGQELTLVLSKVKDPKVLRGLQLSHKAVTNSEILSFSKPKDQQRVQWAAQLTLDLIDALVSKLN